MTETLIDVAHAAMQAAPEDDAARLRFFERLADSQLFLLLTKEAEGENISPEVFEVADGRFVLAFDSEERLSTFTGQISPYAALSGRMLAQMLAGQEIGMGVNLEVAPSSILIPQEALGWLVQTLDETPDRVEAGIGALHPPIGLPEPLLVALDAKLASAGGLASHACLAAVTYADGTRGHLLGFVDAVPGAETALAKSAGEALTFSGIEAGTVDVGFFAADEDIAGTLDRVGLRFDLPKIEAPAAPEPQAPGSNPDKPPILR